MNENVAKLVGRPVFVIPAQAGIHAFRQFLDARFRGHDGKRDFRNALMNLKDHEAGAIPGVWT